MITQVPIDGKETATETNGDHSEIPTMLLIFSISSLLHHWRWYQNEKPLVNKMIAHFLRAIWLERLSGARMTRGREEFSYQVKETPSSSVTWKVLYIKESGHILIAFIQFG